MVAAPGHTPDQIAFFDERDRTLIAGDAFQTQGGTAVSGVMRKRFPFPAMAQELVQLMRLVMGSMGITGEDATHAIRGLRAILHGFATLESAEGFLLSADPEESFQRLLDSFLVGLQQT